MTQPKQFSRRIKTYVGWSAQAKPSSYKERIKRLHALYPEATLSQLRGHPRKKEKLLSKLIPKKVFQLEYKELLPREKELREKSLKVLSKMRREGLSLSRASEIEEIKISPKTVIRHTNALNFVRGRWKAKKYDKISRVMAINEKGNEIYLNIKNSRYASIIGKYQNAVKQFLETGDEKVLEPFRGKKIKDAKGNWHTLDTDPENLYEIHERREEEEFYEIYRW